MLVLKRKKDERIMIGDGIVVTVTEIGPDYVRLGLTAPQSVAVDREEVRADKLAAARRKAAELGDAT